MLGSEEWVLIVPAERKRLASIRNFVAAFAQAAGAPPKRVEGLVLAVDELATNVIVHGLKEQQGDLTVICFKQADFVYVALHDRAPVYDSTQAPEPNLHLPLEQRPAGGLGLHLVRKTVDLFEHRARAGGGNELTVGIRLDREPGG